MNAADFDSLLDELRFTVRDFDLFEAAYLLGYSQRELAERLGVSERMVRRRLKRVREEIAQIMQQVLLV